MDRQVGMERDAERPFSRSRSFELYSQPAAPASVCALVFSRWRTTLVSTPLSRHLHESYISMYLYLDTRQAPTQGQATQQPVEKRQRRRKQHAPSTATARKRALAGVAAARVNGTTVFDEPDDLRAALGVLGRK